MTSPQKPSKPVSRWGFLQQAVASVESKLDTILADDEDLSKKPITQTQPAKENTTPKRASADLPRSNSVAPSNDRLQERLARAMAKRTASRTDWPKQTSEPVSRTVTPSNDPTDTNEPRPSGDGSRASIVGEARVVGRNSFAESDTGPQPDTTPSAASVSIDAPSTPTSDRNSMDASQSIRSVVDDRNSTLGQTTTGRGADQLCEDQEADQSRLQDELNDHLERIDALQAKLLYLSKEAAESAREAAASAQAGSVERKLLEKDEKIALLMEEGQKLSKTEMKQLLTIRKLRGQVMASNNEALDMKLRAEKAEKDLLSMEERTKRAEIATRKAEENLASSLGSSRDYEAIAKERNALAATMAEMRAQLARATARAEMAESKAQTDLLDKERKRNNELQEDLVSAKLERELSEDKLRKEIRDLRASLEREKEHSRAMETEMLGEHAALESKLESFRARAEAASSNHHGDSQANLLRQIETLQRQYAAASQNWQGIEGSLLTRIKGLEKERDDATAREGSLRKKLRDMTLKFKANEQELEENNTRHLELSRSHAEIQNQFQRTARNTQQLEEELAVVKRDFEQHRVQTEKEISRRLEEEKAKWAASNTIYRNNSPGASIRKGSGVDLGYLMSPTFFDRTASRRPSVLPNTDSNTPPRQQSTPSFRGLTNGGVVDTPSIITSVDNDEYFVNVPPTPASQTHTTSHRGVNDLISTSTVGAGPSVQLVERMSANVRRLESEKAASKDELARLTSQRDEARQEVVTLMREVEQKRAVDDRLKVLEEDYKRLNDRYQTTLEMLGEKSELVEELKADVADVKQMYRELVNTMK